MSDIPRDPTQAMLDAARDWSVEQFHRGIGNKAAIGCWQAMYDAAKPDLVRQAVLTKVTNDAENAIVDWCVRIIEECQAEAGRIYGSESTISADKAIRRIREEMETSKFVAAASGVTNETAMEMVGAVADDMARRETSAAPVLTLTGKHETGGAA